MTVYIYAEICDKFAPINLAPSSVIPHRAIWDDMRRHGRQDRDHHCVNIRRRWLNRQVIAKRFNLLAYTAISDWIPSCNFAHWTPQPVWVPVAHKISAVGLAKSIQR